MTPEAIAAIIDSDTLRFHANRDPALRGSIGTREHQWMAASLYLCLCPKPRLQTAWAILWHDVDEAYTCDVPSPLKQARPDLALIMAELSAIVSADLGIPILDDPREIQWCKLCDRLSDYMHVASAAPWQLECEDWQEARAEIGGIAESLGIGSKVEAVLCEVDA